MRPISRRAFLGTAASALVTAGCATETPLRGASNAPNAEAPPNLLFVFPDEFRRQAVGRMGEDPAITPNLDRFADESVLLTQAVSNRPVCSPYRASLLTGKYPFSTGVTGNCWTGSAGRNNFLHESERCISDVLHTHGYSCGYIGKWHLEEPVQPYLHSRGASGVWDEYTPPGKRRHGFGFWHAYGCHDDHFHPHYWIGDAPRERETQFDEWSPRHEANVAIDFIRNSDGKQRDPGKPFALFVSMNPPHMPFQMVPQEYVQRYGNQSCEQLLTRSNVNLNTAAAQEARKWAKHYFAAVTGVDEQFGRILASLNEAGLTDNTIVVFTSDHGEMMGSQGLMNKTVWYEESFGVPFILRWPKSLRPRRDDLLLSTPDIMPTLLGLMGLRGAIPRAVEGADCAEALLTGSGKRPSSVLYLNPDPANPAVGARGIRTHRHKFVVTRTAGAETRFLYDLEKDPYETSTIAEANPALEHELVTVLNRWLAQTRDPWRTTAR